jgi:DNA gyrase subunit A
MKLKAGDQVVSCDLAKDDTSILMITERGFGKRVQLDKFNVQGRGGQGVKGIKFIRNKGVAVVAAFMVGDEDEIVAVASDGQTIRTPVHGIRHIGRDATGVSIMNLAEGQTVASVALILATDDDD